MSENNQNYALIQFPLGWASEEELAHEPQNWESGSGLKCPWCETARERKMKEEREFLEANEFSTDGLEPNPYIKCQKCALLDAFLDTSIQNMADKFAWALRSDGVVLIRRNERYERKAIVFSWHIHQLEPNTRFLLLSKLMMAQIHATAENLPQAWLMEFNEKNAEAYEAFREESAALGLPAWREPTPTEKYPYERF